MMWSNVETLLKIISSFRVLWILCIFIMFYCRNLLWNEDVIPKEIWMAIGRLFGSCVFCAPLDRYFGRHVDRHSADISIEMCRSTYQPRYRPICRPRVVVRLSADMSIDRLPTFRRYLTNRTEWSPIWSVIIRLINKIGRPRNGSPIC